MRKSVVTTLALGFCALLAVSGSLQADDQAGSSRAVYTVASRKSRHRGRPVEARGVATTEDAPADPAPSGSYINIGEAGVGPTWDSAFIPLNTESGESIQWGTFDGRYWVNQQFGFDAGFGLGFPQISPKSQTMVSFRAEGMFVIKEARHNVFYADAEILPMFTSGSGSSTSFLALQGGLGLEHAVGEIPNVSVYTEWEPVSFGVFSPGGGESNNTSLGFLGSVMNFTAGFRYYF